ncbi:MAG: methyltransferase domain-containing protein [Rhodospirillaceae bacterium]|nr:methyltransferase domain-containing protein [Rhodospirillaceae bacterium]
MSEPSFSDDTLLDGRVKIRQPTDGYRVAVDPVLLAAAVSAKSGQRVLDVGCGTGAAMFCLAARVTGVDVTGIEIQPALAKFAEDGIARNNFGARARVVTGDLMALPDIVCATAFDVVMTNPPYGAEGTVSPKESVAQAHHEREVELQDWLTACLKLLKPNGRLAVIHRADRLSDVLAAVRPHCGDIHIIPIYPKPGQPARRVIVEAGKGRKTGDTLTPGLVLHAPDGSFTLEAARILRDGQGLSEAL